MCARVRVCVCALMLMVCVWMCVTCYSVDVWMRLNFHDVNVCALGGHQARLQCVAIRCSIFQRVAVHACLLGVGDSMPCLNVSVCLFVCSVRIFKMRMCVCMHVCVEMRMCMCMDVYVGEYVCITATREHEYIRATR